MKSEEQYGYVVHSRWSDDEQPKATVIRSRNGWLWHDICVTDPDSAMEISEALGCMDELHDLRKSTEEIEQLRDELAAWQGTVRAHEHINAKTADEIQRLRSVLQLVIDQLEEGLPKSAQQCAIDALENHSQEAP